MKENQLLHALAKRKKPDYHYIDDDDWYVENYSDYGKGSFKCLICDFDLLFEGDEYSALVELFDHGDEHLKESNLLIFL